MNHSDQRLDKIEEVTVYGLFHDGLLIYAGATTQPLPRRLAGHKKNARRGYDREVYQYMSEHVDLDEDITIRELPDYDTEQGALDALSASTLNYQTNVNSAATYEGYNWTSEELDVLEEHSINRASELLDASYNACRRAAIKLGIADRQSHTKVDWSQWDDALGTMPDAELAQQIGCTKANVARRRRKRGIEAYGDTTAAFTEAEAREVYLLYQATDASYSDLAEEHGITQSAIGKLVRGDTYAGLDREALNQAAGVPA